MARSSLRRWSSLSAPVLIAVLVATGYVLRAPSAPAAEGQILTISTDSLTTYLPTAATGVQGVRPLPQQRGRESVEASGPALLTGWPSPETPSALPGPAR